MKGIYIPPDTINGTPPPLDIQLIQLETPLTQSATRVTPLTVNEWDFGTPQTQLCACLSPSAFN